MCEFSFVILTDTHLDVRPERQDTFWWNRMAITRSEESLRTAVAEINARRPDFVVHCGDLTHAADTASFERAAQILGQLDMPCHVVPGNHDTYKPESQRVFAELFGVNDGRFYRSRYASGWRLLFLDTVHWLCKDGTVRTEFLPDEYVDIAVPPDEVAWLRAEFERDAQTPTLCFTHTVMAVRDAYPVSRLPAGKEPESRPVRLDYYVTCAELNDVLKQQSCVKAGFYGHGHFHDCLVQDGIMFCQTGGLVSYPCEMRAVSVAADRIDTQVLGLGTDEFAAYSYVEEWDNRWVAGRDSDRSGTHAL